MRTGNYHHTAKAKAKISAAMSGRTLTKETRAKMREIALRRAYSAETRRKMSESAIRERRLRRYNLTTKTRNGALYRRWREAVLARDNYICQRCGAKPKGRALCVHHHKPWLKSKRARFDIENGVTACRSCHLTMEWELHPRKWLRIRRQRT